MKNLINTGLLFIALFFISVNSFAESPSVFIVDTIDTGSETITIYAHECKGDTGDSTNFHSSNGGAYVENHTMCIYPVPPCPQVPPTVNTFYVKEFEWDSPTNWAYMKNSQTNESYSLQWYRPDGTSIQAGPYYIAYNANWCLSSTLNLSATSQNGNWKVHFYYGYHRYTDFFKVKYSSAGWQSAYNLLFQFPEKDPNIFRNYRDEVLLKNPLGKSYVDRLYDRSHEVALVLLLNADIRKQARHILGSLKPEAEAILAGGESFISEEFRAESILFLDALAEEAGPELASLIEDVKVSLNNPENMKGFGFLLLPCDSGDNVKIPINCR